MSNKKKRKYSSNVTKKPAAKQSAHFPLWAKITAVAAAAVLLAVIIFAALPRTQYAYIEIEDYGTIKVELYDDVAPKTVKNFVKLAKQGFYDGLTFHRIMEGFMMQGGDPKGNGSGGYEVNGVKQTIVGEFSANGYENNLSHTRGVISMARSNDYNSASSQFFIVHETSQSNQRSLDGNYAGFGMVVSGIEIVDAICEAAEPTDNNGTIPAAKQPVIVSVTIETVIG